jgi:hypothetical protein
MEAIELTGKCIVSAEIKEHLLPLTFVDEPVPQECLHLHFSDGSSWWICPHFRYEGRRADNPRLFVKLVQETPIQYKNALQRLWQHDMCLDGANPFPWLHLVVGLIGLGLLILLLLLMF